MAGTDFETAAREQLSIITVIVNNGAMVGYEKNIPIATERSAPGTSPASTPPWLSPSAPLPNTSPTPTRSALPSNVPRKVSATGQPCVLEIITREEPVFSLYYR